MCFGLVSGIFSEPFFFLWDNKIRIVHINNAPYLSDWLVACKLLGISCTAHLRGNWKPKRYSLRRLLIRHYDLW